jgi:hypothetical protein
MSLFDKYDLDKHELIIKKVVKAAKAMNLQSNDISGS